jgi:hypothetical protein
VEDIHIETNRERDTHGVKERKLEEIHIEIKRERWKRYT